MTTHQTDRRRRWPRFLGYAVGGIVGLYAVLVLVTAESDVAFWLAVAAVVAVDGFLLWRAATRRSFRVAVRCAVVAVAAALVQAVWVYIPFRWDVLPADGSRDLTWFGSALFVGLLVSFALMLRRRSYPYGWAVLMGTVQGFAVSFLTLLALLMTALGGD